MTTAKHPIQPIVTDDKGVLRFKENHIVSDLLDFASNHGFDLNEIACRDYSRGDRQQLAQLIGYSLSGYGSLHSYVDDDAYAAAQLMAGGLDEMEARTEHLQSTLNALRTALVQPMAELFGVHPNDLSANLPEPDLTTGKKRTINYIVTTQGWSGKKVTECETEDEARWALGDCSLGALTNVTSPTGMDVSQFTPY